jgi:hypothetical protein
MLKNEWQRNIFKKKLNQKERKMAKTTKKIGTQNATLWL